MKCERARVHSLVSSEPQVYRMKKLNQINCCSKRVHWMLQELRLQQHRDSMYIHGLQCHEGQTYKMKQNLFTWQWELLNISYCNVFTNMYMCPEIHVSVYDLQTYNTVEVSLVVVTAPMRSLLQASKTGSKSIHVTAVYRAHIHSASHTRDWTPSPPPPPKSRCCTGYCSDSTTSPVWYLITTSLICQLVSSMYK